MGGITRTNFGCTAKRTLTAAELIAAFAAGDTATIEMVPARNAVYYVPFAGAVRISWNADFGNVDAGGFCFFSVEDLTGNAPLLAAQVKGVPSDVFVAGGSSLTLYGCAAAVWAANALPTLPIADYANKPINFFIDNNGAGPFTLGGISTIELTCFYLAL